MLPKLKNFFNSLEISSALVSGIKNDYSLGMPYLHGNNKWGSTLIFELRDQQNVVLL